MGTETRPELEQRVRELESVIRQLERTEAALRESEAKYRRLHESMVDAFARVNMQGLIVESNPAFQQMVGYSADELKRLTYRDLTPICWHESEQKIIAEQIMRRGFSDIFCKEYIRKDGMVVPVELRTFLLRDNEGHPISMWAIVRDITQRKLDEDRRRQTELRLLEAQKLESLAIMAGGVTHDFNNLLMGILGNAELAEKDIPEDSPVRESLREITVSASRAAQLCRQLLSFAGQGNVSIETMDISEIVRDIARLMAKTTPGRVAIELNLHDGLPAVRGDVSQIRQMIMNLVVNAVEAIDKCGGFVRIATGAMNCSSAFLKETHHGNALPDGEYVWIEVTDSGCGIELDHQRRIFDPFFTTKFTGRGLGLSAALGIISSHRGTLRLKSEPGRGTSVLVLLPAADEQPTRSHVSEDKRKALPQGTILLVEDDDAVRVMSEKMIRSTGMEAIVARDGLEAIDLYRAHGDRIDAVLLDMTMPHLNGAETLRELRRINPKVRVALCSGYSASEIENRMDAAEMPAFLQKPYSAEQLRTCLARLLAS